MGGDHKCPVCQATFTRPQHVARHMRSHTGDRPYKCQHCGDQFARSDLLARHVNKCHANEKAANGSTALTNGTRRRKGAASASRATTSKQACDQCVQSSLPCDGCNPCSKCVQRKCRCTYVKFHRQTAPAGPGHNNIPGRSSLSGSLSSSLGSNHSGLLHSRMSGGGGGGGGGLVSVPMGLGHHDVDFMLGSTGLGGSSMMASSSNEVGNVYAHPPFSFDPSPDMSSRADFAAKYRAQADVLQRSAGQEGTNGGYPDPNWFGWHQNQDTSEGPSYPSGMYGAPRSRPSTGYSSQGGDYARNEFMTGRARSGSLDYDATYEYQSENGSGGVSVPSSAASSYVHLPLEGGRSLGYHDSPQHQSQLANQTQTQNQYPIPQHHPTQDLHHSLRHSTSHPTLGHPPNSTQNAPHQIDHANGGFSSAFGLMSIDDPNVMSGLANDSAPFFSTAAMNMPPQDPGMTPIPGKAQQQQQQSRAGMVTPGLAREAETRELRDFWKAYIHTPLEVGNAAQLQAPFLMPPLLQQHQQQQSQQQQPQQRLGPLSPNGTRRVRVNSLPSVKTPGIEYGIGAAMHPGGTTLHGNADDLRSYEAAVLARKAPQLTFVPKKGKVGPPHGSTSASPPSVRADVLGPAAAFGMSRPSSASVGSSLAFAFGGPNPALLPSSSSSSSSTRPRILPEAPLSGALSDRPSFKRLPSQTLGPSHHKRTILPSDVEDDGSGNGSMVTSIAKMAAGAGAETMGGERPAPSGPPRPMVGLSERHRRLGSSGVPLVTTYPQEMGTEAA